MPSLQQVEAVAPDQASMKAASKLMKAGKWSLRAVHADNELIWGECQGSGAKPYRVMADIGDLGTKCTCPSRKFPCKHALALLWMYAESADDFQSGDVPEWVSDWLGRRRKTPKQDAVTCSEKDLVQATGSASGPVVDEKTLARREAASARRRARLLRDVEAATHDLEQWIGDQLRTGLSSFLNDTHTRCRRIAARMVDAKAQALAGRIDELPSRLLAHRSEARLDAAIAELGKLILLVRAWRAAPEDPELFRAVISSETREQLFDSDTAITVKADWEVLGSRMENHRNDLISDATWLLNLDLQADTPAIALLLDFFPKQLGRRSTAFVDGEQFHAKLVFYPAVFPQRAVMDTRTPLALNRDWPGLPTTPDHPLTQLQAQRNATPWLDTAPLMLPAGRVGKHDGRLWWQDEQGATLPLTQKPSPFILGTEFSAGIGIWTNGQLDLLAASSNFGKIHFHA